MTPETISRKISYINDRLKELKDLSAHKKSPGNFHNRALERLYL